MIRIIRRRTRRGITFVELLVSALLMSIGVMGLVGTWAFSYRVTENTDHVGMAYNVGRMVLEQRVKLLGFSAPEGTQEFYYTGNGLATTSTAANRLYRVTLNITSDMVNSGTAGQTGAVPNPYALRSVTITVRRTDTSAVVWTTATRLVRAGV
jgi:Tfp pilus assembly protein PilV